ncbi:MAG: 3D domain-containing protein, partial [Cyanobacteria bacterium P01_H01_bin.121]
RNNRFIFFRETAGAPPQGSLSVPVAPDRSVATDKSLMPPGALTLVVAELPYLANPNATAGALPFAGNPEALETRSVQRYMLDQDTGGAIRGAGRADLFLGTGRPAELRSGAVNTLGELYYLLLKPCP